jgi:hypothetical protein
MQILGCTSIFMWQFISALSVGLHDVYITLLMNGRDDVNLEVSGNLGNVSSCIFITSVVIRWWSVVGSRMMVGVEEML